MKALKDNLRYIFGFKLKQIRQKKGLGLKELSKLTGLSISYLSEIEKGLKYPKPEKIFALSEALDVSFESLVSIKTDEELNPLKDLINSPFMLEFPFELFDISPHDVLNLVNESPHKANAFLRTLYDIGQIYDMRVEHFYFAAIRTYQKMNMNYFPELEQSASNFIKLYKLNSSHAKLKKQLSSILKTKYNYFIDEDILDRYNELRNLRSVFIEGKSPKLLLNSKLLESQKIFILAKELGYNYLELTDRTPTSSWLHVDSFDQVLNNFKASYFAGAIMIKESSIKNDLKILFNNKKWDNNNFVTIMKKYDATPEMFVYRIGHIIPKFFKINEFHFLRFNNKVGENNFKLIKELNMSPVLAPHSIGLNEHYCRRWLGIGLLNKLAAKQKDGSYTKTLVAAQRAKFIESNAEFFTISLARPLALSSDTNSSMIIGFLINDNFKDKVKFWNDPDVPSTDINETCERCGLTNEECNERVAPPHIFNQNKSLKIRASVLEKLKKDLEQH